MFYLAFFGAIMIWLCLWLFSRVDLAFFACEYLATLAGTNRNRRYLLAWRVWWDSWWV